MKLSIKAGATSQSINIFIQDSSSTTGAGLAGLAYNTAGLTAYYSFAGASATATAITLATLATVTTAYSSGGFIAIDGTNMPGWYRLDLPNAAIASGNGRSVALHLKGATNMAPLPIEIELTGWDNQDAIHGGLSALPNVAAGASGGLPTGDASGHVTFANTSIATVTNLTNLPSIPNNWLTAAGIAASALNGKGDWNVGKTGYSLTQTFPTNFASLAITAGGAVTAGTVSDKTGYSISGTKTTLDALNDITAGAVWDVTLSGHLTTGTTGNALNAAGAAGDPWSTSLPGAYGAGTAGNIVGNNLNATVSSRLASSAISLSGGAVTVGTNNDKTGYALTTAYDPAKTASQAGDAMALTSAERNSTADAILDRNMGTGTDSGSPTVRTVRQALRFLRNKWAISSGTLTVYKEDDTTASWTATVGTDGTAQPIVSNDPA